MRGYEYLEFVGDRATFFNAELRFPFINAMLTPIGILGGIRGVFFANMGGASWQGQPFKWWARGSETVRPIVDYNRSIVGNAIPIYGPATTVDGFRLVDARGSYGIGLETFALGFPIHFDYSWKTLFNKDWEDVTFYMQGGHSQFRKPKFSLWIGYDF
jgi:outer membrane protein assembly factor BamA